MFALVALGMCFVIMTGGIDLSVGSIAALGSVVAALLRPYGLVPASLAGVAAGLARRRSSTASLVTRLRHPALHRHARHHAGGERHRAAARRQPVGLGLLRHAASSSSARATSWASRSPPGSPVVAFVAGLGRAQPHRLRPHVLAVGGNEDATRLMGLPADRVKAARSTSLSGGARRARRRDPRRAVRRRPADRGRRLGAVRHRLGGGRRHAAHRRRRLGRRDARRRAAARPHLQHPELRERPRLDQPLAPTGSR